jgi:hypothetical protein
VTSPTVGGAQTLEDARVRYLVTRAALRAAKAMTTPDLKPEQRLETLMECHGTMLAARGPLSPLPFGEFRRALRGDLAALVPEGVSALDLNGILVVDQDGQITEDAFDLDLEQQMLLHTLRKLDKTAGSVSDRELQSEIDQETAFTRPQREAPTGEELLRFAAGLPPEEAEALLARAHPAPRVPEPEAPGPVAAPPAYVSWEEFLDRTTAASRMAWCRKKAARANRPRLMSGPPDVKITGPDVWTVLQAAGGRCEHCGSLAVENRPSAPDGRPLPWAPAGRRIGSLGHRVARFNGGPNAPGNLAWACLWCNTWPSERRPGATDHGGIQPLRE